MRASWHSSGLPDELDGPLTPAAAAAFADRPFEFLHVEADGPLFVEVGDEAVGVWLDPWKRDGLQGELMRAWWEPAQARPAARGRRRVSRETRARIHRAWESVCAKIAAILIGGVAARLVAETFTNMLVATVVVLAIVFTIGDARKLWYEDSEGS